VLAVFAAALAALFRWSLLEFIPGSLRARRLHAREFPGVLARSTSTRCWDTVSSLRSPPSSPSPLVSVAYALARTPSRAGPLGAARPHARAVLHRAIVRTYAWVLVLGQHGDHLAVPMLFTERGVLVGLVHFSMPTMILILAAALSHIDPAYERAAASLGRARRASSGG
jgi:putative spermidine/putrescine transport system permease protein